MAQLPGRLAGSIWAEKNVRINDEKKQQNLDLICAWRVGCIANKIVNSEALRDLRKRTWGKKKREWANEKKTPQNK